MRFPEKRITDPDVSIEACSIMYTRTTIWFRADPNRFDRFFASFTPESLPSIRSILIDYDCLSLMGAYYDSLVAASEPSPGF